MNLARFIELTVMPEPDVQVIEGLESGWTQRQIDRIGAMIDTRCIKRYAVPFGGTPDPGLAPLRSDVPMIIEEWITAILTLRAYAKRGFNPSSGDTWFEETIVGPAKQAMADIKEAADSKDGLFELPLKESTANAGGVSKAGILAYTETSPYVNMDLQEERGREEDAAGEGTYS